MLREAVRPRHRIGVSPVLDRLASVRTIEEILHVYPQLERDDVLACIAYGAEMARPRTYSAGSA